jgi:hypothetical protein
MARPERNNVDYFPFICEDGNKMFYIEETYGNDGFATFVKLLRELAKTNYHYLDLSKPTTVMFLSAKCKVSKETLLSIIKDLVELGKFDAVLWNENSIIWCQDFVDSIQDAYHKRNNKCITYDGLLQLLIGLGVRKLSKSKTTVPVNPQSIVEDTKPNESKENIIPTWDDFLAYGKEKEPSINIQALKNKYDAWIENGWKDGNDNKISKWKVKLLNTLTYIEKDFKDEPKFSANFQHPNKPIAL